MKIAHLALLFMGLYVRHEYQKMPFFSFKFRFPFQPGMIYVYYVLFFDEGRQLMYAFAKRTRSLLTADDAVRKKIREKGEFLKFIIIFVIFLAVGVAVLLLPIFGDEWEINLVFQAAKFYFDEGYRKTYISLIVVMQVLFFHGTLVTLNSVFAVIYVCYEVEFQLLLLQSALKKVAHVCYKKHEKNNEIHRDREMQKYIRVMFRDCILHYNDIKAYYV